MILKGLAVVKGKGVLSAAGRTIRKEYGICVRSRLYLVNSVFDTHER